MAGATEARQNSQADFKVNLFSCNCDGCKTEGESRGPFVYTILLIERVANTNSKFKDFHCVGLPLGYKNLKFDTRNRC